MQGLWCQEYIQIYTIITQKYRNVIVHDLRKNEKSKYKQDKQELNIDFLNDGKLLGVFLKYLILKLPIASKRDS